MELRKSFDYKKILVVLYFVMAAVFLVVGFMPVGATAQYEISGELAIPVIGLKSGVATLELDNGRLNTPEDLVGSFSRRENKTLLIGHASTVFDKLKDVTIGNVIVYGGTEYTVVDAVLLEKEEIKMNKVLKTEKTDTLVLMTCAGEDLGNGDATHRFMLTAKVL